MLSKISQWERHRFKMISLICRILTTTTKNSIGEYLLPKYNINEEWKYWSSVGSLPLGQVGKDKLEMGTVGQWERGKVRATEAD